MGKNYWDLETCRKSLKRCMPPPTDVTLDIITFEHNHDRPSNKKIPGRKLLLFCVRSIYLNLAHFPFLCFTMES